MLGWLSLRESGMFALLILSNTVVCGLCVCVWVCVRACVCVTETNSESQRLSVKVAQSKTLGERRF